MRDLKKAYDHETKVFNFLAKKGVKRVNKKQESREMEEKRLKELKAEKKCEEHNKILDEICVSTCREDSNIWQPSVKCPRGENKKLLAYLR